MNNKFKMNLQLFAENATIYDVVKASEIKSYWDTTKEQRKPYLGEILFPATKQIGLDMSFIKGAGGLPIALKASAFDVETPLRDRIGFTELKEEMPFFKEGFLIKERDRQELLRVLASGQKEYADIIIDRIFQDNMNLINGARVQAERMRMQLLSDGKIEIKIGDTPKVYDYLMPEDNKVTLTDTDKWDNPAADIVGDIEKWKKHIKRTQGVEVDKILLTDKTFTYITKNKAIVDELKASTGVSMILTDEVIENYLRTKLGLTVVKYDEPFRNEKGEIKQLYPDNVVTLLPPTSVGQTVFGTTPEEADLLSGVVNAEVSIVETGVALTTEKRIDPVNVFTKASAIMLPSGENIDKIFIATVV